MTSGKSQGILPTPIFDTAPTCELNFSGLKKESKILEAFTPDIEVGGWSLPGHGVAYHDCGETLIFGCLDVEKHVQAKLDGKDVVGKIFVDMRKRSCVRAECPVCYEKWAGKGASQIEWVFENFKMRRRPIHYVVSVPRSLWHVPLIKLRTKAQALAKKTNFWGGCCIPHPFREICLFCGSHKDFLTKRCESCGAEKFLWYFSPHFHMIGFGWIHGHKVKEISEETGWVFRNLGVRESVGATALYQLSHCGVHKNHHSVTWFGIMARNKMQIPKKKREDKTCPLCGGKLVKLIWYSSRSQPELEEGENFLDPDVGWVLYQFGLPGGGVP